MSTTNLFASGNILIVLALVSVPPITFADYPHLTEVIIERPGVGDTSNLLHIKKLTGNFKFDSEVKKVTLVCEFYKNGQKLSDVPEVAATIDPADGGDSGSFAIQIADLDYLQLGDGQKNHCRVVLELEL
jgi:hypothetical protein